MRRTFHLLTIIISNGKNRRDDVVTVWLHDLNLLTDCKLISLLDMDASILRHIADNTKVCVFLYVRIAVVDLRLVIWFSIDPSPTM